MRDVTSEARRFGILLPTAITDSAWKCAIAWPEADDALRWETGRARTVLAHAARALLRAQSLGIVGLQLFNFTPVTALDGKDLLTLGVEIGAGDAGEPVVTITTAADH
ncbi:hypothetical protein ACFYRW_22565 [Rhodococcus pyridinivorans]|uniref:hypothetical protein n=1 Tax=Rhodococcus pyridinivorans TaxID=103816 RepID=UPI0036A19D2A